MMKSFWHQAGLALVVGATSLAAQTPTKRALVIGIDKYQQPATQLATWRAAVAPAIAQWRTRTGAPAAAAADPRATVTNLDGSVNDAMAFAAMLRSAKYGFTDVRILTDAQATRAGIIAALDKLVLDAKPKDVVVIYYAGHGSQRVNSLTTNVAHLDQTIVPIDVNAGQFDIRDMELAAYFNKLVDKGAVLSLIFDSCHSGSLTRGETVPGKRRWAAADPRDAREAPPAGAAPEDKPNGALFLAAAEDFQSAQETFDPIDQKAHGAFTSALLRVMRLVPANAPATQVFARTRAILQQDDRAQNAIMRGVGADRARPLFGLSTTASLGGVSVAVQRVEEDTVLLQGGLEMGFGQGSELHLADSIARKVVRLRVAAPPAMGLSKAVAISGHASDLRSGDLMLLDRWVEPDRPALRTWIPAAVSSAALASAVTQLVPLRTSTSVEWVSDPSTLPDDGRSLYVVRHDASGWQIQSPTGTLTSLAAPTATAVQQGIIAEEAAAASRAAKEAATLHQPAPQPPGTPRVFVILPPTTQLRAAIGLGRAANDAVSVQTNPQGADYLLVGRDTAGTIEYSWLRPNTRAGAGDLRSLPVRTDWIAADPANDSNTAARLETKAVALARVNGWLTIKSPAASEDEPAFPYQLSLRNIATGEVKDSGTTKGKEHYDIVLRRDASINPSAIQPRWVYLFSVDSRGKGTLLWTADNTIPYDSAGKRSAPAEIIAKPNGPALGGRPYIPIGAPYGADTFIMVSSAQQLDAQVFEFDPVITRGGPEGVEKPKTPLETLFSRVSGATRGVTEGVPVNWSIQRIVLKSEKP